MKTKQDWMDRFDKLMEHFGFYVRQELKCFVKEEIDRAVKEEIKRIIKEISCQERPDMEPPNKSLYKGEHYIRETIARVNFNDGLKIAIDELKVNIKI